MFARFPNGWWRGGSQPYLWPSDAVGVRDMMIDRVAPSLGCGRSVSLGRPRVTASAVAVVARSDKGVQGAGRGWCPSSAEVGLPVLTAGSPAAG